MPCKTRWSTPFAPMGFFVESSSPSLFEQSIASARIRAKFEKVLSMMNLICKIAHASPSGWTPCWSSTCKCTVPLHSSWDKEIKVRQGNLDDRKSLLKLQFGQNTELSCETPGKRWGICNHLFENGAWSIAVPSRWLAGWNVSWLSDGQQRL